MFNYFRFIVLKLILFRFLWNKRFIPHKIRYNKYIFEVPDYLSFFWQIKEIFLDESYNFRSPRKVPIIYDCGANIGISIIFFKKKHPNAKIYAFEPDPIIIKYLRKNLIANKISDVTIYEQAVWNKNEDIKFIPNSADGGSIYGKGQGLTVKAVRLKELLIAEPYVDLLKIDIEGAETEVIIDCSEELKKINNIFIEYHSVSKNPQELDKILYTLTKNNFRYYILPASIYNLKKSPFIEEYTSENTFDIQLNIFATNNG